MLACLVPLYWAKSEADRMRDHMHSLQSDVKDARKSVKTLEAEVAYLSRYDRIEKVAVEQMGMAPLDGSQLADISDLDAIAPIITENSDKAKSLGKVENVTQKPISAENIAPIKPKNGESQE